MAVEIIGDLFVVASLFGGAVVLHRIHRRIQEALNEPPDKSERDEVFEQHCQETFDSLLVNYQERIRTG
ncbi:MAG: hypothetical protein F4Z28_18060 [Gammaproteobacteria bacterium]|nr:hypothetical protein [Gammaproteobacteria bacterium]